MQENSTSHPERILSIDILRGFMLVFMVLVHFMIYYGNPEAAQTWSHFIFNHVLGDWGAPGFLMMMGCSQVLSAQKHESSGNPILLKRACLRGLFIFFAGLLMIVLAWGPHEIWQWDILTLMGFSTILLFFCRFLPSWFILCVITVLAVCTPWWRHGIDFKELWGGQFVQVPVISRYLPGILFDPAGEYKVLWRFKDVIRGFFLTGYFPVLPWVIFPLAGFVIGRRIVNKKMQRDLPALIILGLVLACLGMGGAYFSRTRPDSAIVDGFLAPLSFYPDSFTMVCFQMGMAIAILSALYYFYDVRGKDRNKMGFIVQMYIRTSSFSLTFYFLHYLLIGWPLALIYFITGKHYAGNLMGETAALFIGLTGVMVLEAIIFYWKKRGSIGSMEWILNFIIERFASIPK
ncbi:MAG TPA: heparan-alpha-glucosaminide N-acetyltransferase domain-containing protein [Thermodesulfobacteriota bacterium]|nr:heparan-alpha-glucosaminide N-acetyltransferase domain-containing protein [Thermodesulfobacteriota bacterium]